MIEFELHTEDSAPEASRERLAESKKSFGMVPNLHAVMAESPELLTAYKQVHELFMASSFNADELTVVWQTINVENRCHYCVPAHTGIAKSMNVDDAIIQALRNKTPLPTERLEALRDFTLSMVRDRGQVSEDTIQSFLNAGYGKQQMLELILGYAQKIMSNYTNHLANTPLDKPFEVFSWQ